MYKLFKFFKLTVLEKFLLILGFFTIVIFKMISLIFPPNIINKITNIKLKTICKPANKDFYTDKIIWSVETVANYIPFTNNCLIKSSSIHFMLSLFGIESKLQFGVLKEKENELIKAHSWIESHGKIYSANTEENYIKLGRQPKQPI